MYTLKKTINICCAHHLEDSSYLTTKQCLNNHGHNYRVTVTIKTDSLISGMVVDFGKIKEIVNTLDHNELNFFIENPTAENMAKYLHDKIHDCLEGRTGLVEIEIEETDGSSIKYEI